MNIPLNINWQQILLHLLNFAILAGGLHVLLYKPVKKFMEQRTQHYQAMKNEAEETLQRAQDLEKTREAQLQEIQKEIQEKRAQAQASLELAAVQRRESVEQEAASILEEAKRTAAQYQEKAKRDSQQELQELAVQAARKIVFASDSSALDAFLNAAEEEKVHGTNGV